MRLTILWRDGDQVGEVTLDCEPEDGDVIDLTVLPRLESGSYVGDMDTGELVEVGRAN